MRCWRAGCLRAGAACVRIRAADMMMTVVWYQRPTPMERQRLRLAPDEVLATRHADENSVHCIEHKCYVLPLIAYCR